MSEHTAENDAPSDDFHCPRCDDDKGEHTRLYGCRFDDLHDWPGGVFPPGSTTNQGEES